VYKYNPSKITAITNQSLSNFGPAGWDRIGFDIDGEAVNDYSGYSVGLSADGSTLAIGAVYNDGNGDSAGQVRVYKLDTFGAITYTSSNPSVAEIYGNAMLFIKEGASGTTTITATQAATPPFSLTPITVQGTLTVSGTTYTLQYNSIMSTLTPFTGSGASAFTVAYGRAGSQGTGAPLWIVGGSGDNVFARSSRPSAMTTNTWTIDVSNAAAAPFPVCNSLGYSNGVWVAGNNTSATNILARSVDGGSTWTPVTASSVSGILTGAAAIGANAFCNYSLAYADYSNDTNLRSWVAVQGTKNFFFEGGVSTVATVTPDVSAGVYNSIGQTTTTIATAGSVMVAPPGALATTYAADWLQRGADIDGEAESDYSGYSVALSADGTTLAIGALLANTPAGINNIGHVRVYKYNASKTVAQTNQSLPGFGPVGWDQLGADIDGEAAGDQSGWSVALSADGTTVAIGAPYANTPAGTNDVGHVRVYKYNASKTVAQTNQSLPGFGPVGWDQLGADIDGEAQDDYGSIVALSADGTTLAIGASSANNPAGINNIGHVRIYKYNASKTVAQTNQSLPGFGPVGWDQLGADIDGEAQYDQSGYSVALSADGTTVAIAANLANTPAGTIDAGHVRVYKYNASKTVAQTNQSLSGFGPIGWDRLGADIDGDAESDYSGWSVALSADGTTVAIGAITANNPAGTSNVGHVRVYKYNASKTVAQTNQSLPGFGPIGWDQLGADIDGEAQDDQSGHSVALSADGTTVAIGARYANNPAGTSNVGHVRVYKYNANKTVAQTNQSLSGFGPIGWDRLGADIDGEAESDQSGWSVALSADGTTLAIGAITANTPAGTNDVGHVRVYKIPVTNAITYTSSAPSVAEIYGNALLLIKGVAGTSNIVATQGATTTNGVLTVSGTTYTLVYGQGLPWWVAGGVGLSGVASIGATTDPSGATGWTKVTSAAIANLATINSVAFSPHTQRWLAVGAGATGSLGTNILYSDSTGATWTSTGVATALTPVITLNTCIWNQLPTPATISSAGRWLAGGTRNDGGVNNVTVPNSACIYISTDVSGAASPWTPITGTGAILSQVYSIAYNGRVWIAAGAPATDSGSASTLMRTTDPTGATGWVGIASSNTSVGGFDTAARSITWNADQQMWVATGENTATSGSGGAVDASFSSVIYSLDVSGGAGTWRTVRESNSLCFSGEGTGIAFTGDKWFASGEGNKQIVATTGANSASASAGSWSTVSHATTLTRASDIAYTGRRLIATGAGAGSTTGVILSTDNTGASWSAASIGFNDASGGGTSVNFEASYDGVGRIMTTGRSATNALTVSSDGGATWVSSSAQFSSTNTVDTTTQTLFTTGANNAAYVGNDTLFAGGGNDVHWTGKRWVAVGRNSAASGGADTGSVTVTPDSLDIINNNTTPVATSDDGITWQCVRTSQAPNLSEGTLLATNSRVGSTALIDSKIIIADGGDTESNMDYGGMMGGVGGSGTSVGGIDIIAELTPVSNAASGPIVGNASTGSFDTTAFTITTRPTPL
jgi:hypothetical protein